MMKDFAGLLLLLVLFGLALGLGDAFGPEYGEALLVAVAVGISACQLLNNRLPDGTGAVSLYRTAIRRTGADNEPVARPAADAPDGQRDYWSRS